MGFGSFWVSMVGTGAVSGVVVLVSVGCLAAVGPLSAVDACGLCICGWAGLGPC